MNIGFFHYDTYPLKEGSSVQSWNIFHYLQKNNKIYSDKCPFPGVTNNLNSLNPISIREKWNKLDCIFTIIDGTVNFRVERFSAYSQFLFKKKPVIWLINAPIKESLVFNWYKKRNFRYHLLLRNFFSKSVTTAIAVSEAVKDYSVNELGLKNTVVIPNGSDNNHFKNPLTKKETVLDKFGEYYKIMWAGNGIYPWQGIDMIIETARRFQKIDEKVLFVIISKYSWIKIPDLKNLLIIPGVTYNELPYYLSQADICLSLYNYNYGNTFYNSPMKLFDYMSMSKPVIASNLGQIREIIQNDINGITVDNNIDEIISKIKNLKKDKNHAEKLGRKAREDIVNYYNWERVGKDVEKVLISSCMVND